MLATSLLMVHDTERGSQDNETELTGREEVSNPLLNLINLNIKTGGNDTTLVKTSVELDNNLTSTMIIDNLKFTNIA